MSSWWFFFPSYRLSSRLCYYSFCPRPPWHFLAYRLSFIWHSQRPQKWRHASVTLCLISILTDSWFLYGWLRLIPWFSCEFHINASYIRQLKGEYNTFLLPCIYACVCLFLWKCAAWVNNLNRHKMEKCVCTGCSKQVGMWGMGVRAFIFLMPSMLLSLQGEQGFLPPPPHCPSCHGWQALPLAPWLSSHTAK